MIGSSDLNIVGETYDSETIQIFKMEIGHSNFQLKEAIKYSLFYVDEILILFNLK